MRTHTTRTQPGNAAAMDDARQNAFGAVPVLPWALPADLAMLHLAIAAEMNAHGATGGVSAMDTENSITICMGSSCFARGNRRNLEVVEQFLAEHGLTAEIRLVGSRCTEECRMGPNVIINGLPHYGVDSGTLTDLLNAEFITCRQR